MLSGFDDGPEGMYARDFGSGGGDKGFDGTDGRGPSQCPEVTGDFSRALLLRVDKDLGPLGGANWCEKE